MPAALPAACRSIIYVVATLAHKDKTSFIDGYKNTFGPNVRILRAVNGHNQTETLEAFLAAKLQFHNVSRGGRLWGKLATFLTKYQMLMYQVEHQIPYQVTFEDDLVMQPEVFDYIRRQCAWYERQPGLDLLQMSKYAEALMTSLAGATRITKLIREVGMKKNDDQQLLNPAVMGHSVSNRGACVGACYHPAKWRNGTRLGLNATAAIPVWQRPPWVIGRATNRGDIRVSQSLTWAEMALLRVATGSRHAFALPNFGNPPGAEFGGNPYKKGRAQRGQLKFG